MLHLSPAPLKPGDRVKPGAWPRRLMVTAYRHVDPAMRRLALDRLALEDFMDDVRRSIDPLLPSRLSCCFFVPAESAAENLCRLDRRLAPYHRYRVAMEQPDSRPFLADFRWHREIDRGFLDGTPPIGPAALRRAAEAYWAGVPCGDPADDFLEGLTASALTVEAVAATGA